MIDFVADENFDNRIVRELLCRKPELDIVRVQDLVIAIGDDNIVLAWAAQSNRALLTHMTSGQFPNMSLSDCRKVKLFLA
jgi:hypothetical protein